MGALTYPLVVALSPCAIGVVAANRGSRFGSREKTAAPGGRPVGLAARRSQCAHPLMELPAARARCQEMTVRGDVEKRKDRDAKCPSLRVSLDSAHPANG